jgi:hypothetical protein
LIGCSDAEFAAIAGLARGTGLTPTGYSAVAATGPPRVA